MEISQNRQAIIMDALGLIAWIRDAPNLLRPYQIQLLKMNQLRLYLASCTLLHYSAMIDEAMNLYNEIVSFYINRRDFFILNRSH